MDATLWKVLTKTLGSLLKKDWDERLEDDKLIIERILILIRYLGPLVGPVDGLIWYLYFERLFILIRNVLQVPTNVRREGRTMDDVSLHDQVL